jgi:hypothetical protein
MKFIEPPNGWDPSVQGDIPTKGFPDVGRLGRCNIGGVNLKGTVPQS